MERSTNLPKLNLFLVVYLARYRKTLIRLAVSLYHLKQMNMDERNERVLIQISWGWLIRINERLYQRKSDETTEVQIHFEVI
jgi:hypothetical protein